MKVFFPTGIRALAMAAIALLAAPRMTFAQTDEIQVYDGAIAEKGKLGLMLHNNFTPDGQKTPAFPGGLVSHRAYVGVPEWAYGVTDWFEAGLYMPLFSISKDRDLTYNGFKLRALIVRPHGDDRTLAYGVNFEFSVNAQHWDPQRITSEIRPIVGWHLHPVDIIVNPILDTSYDGFKNLDFAPSVRVAYNYSQKWAAAVEEYADYGPLRQFLPAGEQSHQLYAVVNHSAKSFDVEAGVGFGLNGASDKVTFKLMVSRDLN